MERNRRESRAKPAERAPPRDRRSTREQEKAAQGWL